MIRAVLRVSSRWNRGRLGSLNLRVCYWSVCLQFCFRIERLTTDIASKPGMDPAVVVLQILRRIEHSATFFTFIFILGHKTSPFRASSKYRNGLRQPVIAYNERGWMTLLQRTVKSLEKSHARDNWCSYLNEFIHVGFLLKKALS